MIEINGLTKRYRDLVAVNDISFSVAAGEIVGFLGPQRRRKNHHHENADRVSAGDFW